MKKVLLALLAITVFQAAPAALAAGYKIGFVNTERVFREAAPALKAQQKLKKEFAPREQKLQKMAKQAANLQAYLEKEGMVISSADRQAKERKLANLNRELQRAQREFREDLNLRRNEELAIVQERANQAIKEIALHDKYDLILQDVVYASPRIDITKKVLKALANDNKK